MEAMDVPVTCGGVEIGPGDYVFGDVDGVVVLPRAIAAEAIHEAIQKVRAEDRTRQELLQGKTLREVYDTYGVL
jgi:regulator of RNase E activity RraA